MCVPNGLSHDQRIYFARHKFYLLTSSIRSRGACNLPTFKMSAPNPQSELAEYINTSMKITIQVHGETLERVYGLQDGQVPESAKEGLQNMVDILLDNSLEF